MRFLHRCITTLCLWLAVGTAAHALPTFSAQLTGGQEVPFNASTAFGEAALVLNDARTALTFTITINGLDFTGTQTVATEDDLISAHIHASALSEPGTNAGVVFGFFGTPFNDVSPNDVLISPFASGVGGTITGKWDAAEGNNTTLTEQLPNLLAGRAYLNFHTAQFPGGEIRGQILPVPEPGTLALLLLGLVGLGWGRRQHVH